MSTTPSSPRTSRWYSPITANRLTYRRHGHDNLHVRGYIEEGTTTTPFDMVMMNNLDRYHLVMDVIDRVPALGAKAAALRQEMQDSRLRARDYTRAHGEDIPEVADWAWPGTQGTFRNDDTGSDNV